MVLLFTLVLSSSTQSLYAQEFENLNEENIDLYVDASSIFTLETNPFVKMIEIAQDVLIIPENAFIGFLNLEKIILPSSIQSIENNAFPNNPNLVFFVYKGSYAQEYVANMGWNYECIGEEVITTEAQEATTYTIQYQLDGGVNSKLNPETFVSTDAVIELQDPMKEGYVFEGWYIEKEFQNRINQIDTIIQEDIVIFAKWSLAPYSITYEVNGGVFNGEVVTSYTQDSGSIVLPNPLRTGYSFAGWYKEESFNTKVTSIPSGSQEDKTFFAKWIPYKYSIQYVGNGSTSGSMANSTNLVYDSTYNLKANAFQRKGYTFIGWNTKADGSGESYENNASVSNLSVKNGTVIKLFAQWSKNEYSITYHVNGGEFETDPLESYNVTTPTITLPTPTKLGYVFNGWYKEENFKTRITQVTKGSTGDKVLYAKWSLLKYSIQYVGNGSTSGSMTNSTNLVYDSTYSLKANAFQRKGYTFIGWNTKADGSGENYENNASVSNLSVKNGTVIKLFAQWSKNEYSITYHITGGEFETDPLESYNVTTPTITLPTPTKLGYVFNGWYKEENFKTRITKISKGSTGDKKLYAKWTLLKYSIQYVGNGSTSGSMANSVNLVYDSTYPLKGNTYKRKGYTFIGWNTKADGSGESYENKASVSNLSVKNGTVIKLFAQWSKNEYSITYHVNGGEFETDPLESYNVTTPTITLPTPTKLGYVFNGWYKEENFKTRITQVTKGSTGDKVLYAKWSLLKYSIQYVGNGSTSGSMANSTNLVYDSTYNLKANAFQRKGYTFIGWNTKADGSGESYENLDSFKNLSIKNGSIEKLYAQWSPIKYKIVFNGNMSYEGSVETIEATYDRVVILPDNAFTKKNYTFIGWNTKSDGSGIDYSTFEEVKNLTDKQDGTVTLFAKWKLISDFTKLTKDNANYISHRGYNTEASENTVAAFRLAGERGFWGCETDVYITKDNQFVCNHDQTFSRMLGINKTAREMTLEEIQSYSIVSGSNFASYANNPEGNRIASLAEYLNICLEYNMVPIIELKDGAHAGVQAPSYDELLLLYKQVKEIMGENPVQFIGFDYSNLTQMRTILDSEGDSQTRLQYLGSQTSISQTVSLDELQEKRIGVDISYNSITESFINACIAKSIDIVVWTCDKIESALKLLQQGIDYFTTNIQLWK